MAPPGTKERTSELLECFWGIEDHLNSLDRADQNHIADLEGLREQIRTDRIAFEANRQRLIGDHQREMAVQRVEKERLEKELAALDARCVAYVLAAFPLGLPKDLCGPEDVAKLRERYDEQVLELNDLRQSGGGIPFLWCAASAVLTALVVFLIML